VKRRSRDSYSAETVRYFVAFVGLGLTTACLGPTLPSLAAAAGVSLAQIGLLVVVRSLGGMFGSLLAGPLVDHGYGRAAIAGSLLLMVGSMALVPIFGSLAFLIGLFFVLGIGQGALNTGANTLIVWESHNQAQSRLSLLHFSYGLGALVAPILIAWFLSARSNGLFAYWAIAILMTPVLVWMVTTSGRVELHASLSRRARNSSSRAFGWAIVLFFLFVGAETTIGSWLFAFAEQASDATPATAAYLVAVFWMSFMLARLLAAAVATRIRPSTYVLGGVSLSIALSVLILALAKGGIVLWLSVAGMGVAIAVVFPQAYAFCSAVLGMTGRRTALLLIASSLGGMVIPWLAGRFLESTSARSVPLVFGAAMLLALVAFVMILRTAPRGVEEPSV